MSRKNLRSVGLVVGLFTFALTGCGGGSGSVPGLASIAGGQSAGVVNGKTHAVAWSVDLAKLGIRSSRSRGGVDYSSYTFGVSLEFIGDAASPSSVISRQTPVSADGTASISVELALGLWKLDQMTVSQDGQNILVNSAPVTFVVQAGQDTPVGVTLVPVTGTATFTVAMGEPGITANPVGPMPSVPTSPVGPPPTAPVPVYYRIILRLSPALQAQAAGGLGFFGQVDAGQAVSFYISDEKPLGSYYLSGQHHLTGTLCSGQLLLRQIDRTITVTDSDLVVTIE